jgi:hypothetical protein
VVVEIVGSGDGVSESGRVLDLRMVFGVDGASKVLDLLNFCNKLPFVIFGKVHMLKVDSHH